MFESNGGGGGRREVGNGGWSAGNVVEMVVAMVRVMG